MTTRDTRDEPSISPDGITSFVGLRAWFASEDVRDTPASRLVSMNIQYVLGKPIGQNREVIVWPTDGPLEATCGKLRDRPPFIPNRNCECGIYALNHIPPIPPWGVHTVLGLVELWGRYIKGSKGYRAQFARPVALVREVPIFCEHNRVLPDRIERLAEVYGVPLLASVDEAAQRLEAA